jgi:hypothetical protein
MKPILTIFVIATKNYVDYAAKLVESIAILGETDFHLQVILLTDDVLTASRIASPRDEDEVLVREIKSFGWPEATLYRFDLMADNWSTVRGSLVMYMDADTRFVSAFTYSDLLTNVAESESGMVLVRHPGYFKRFFLVKLIVKSRFGPWENNSASAAFMPFCQRGHYVCGGVYWGNPEAFHALCVMMASNIQRDETFNVRAKHNDESHLNFWLSQNPSKTVSPKWAFAAGYRNLKGIDPIIEVIHKPENFQRLNS